MKPRLRAERFRIRAAGDREPSGRLSRRIAAVEGRREETAREARKTAVDARMRLFGVPEELAHTDLASSVVGRLRISREINEDQYQAAMKACRVKNDKDRALGLTQANAAKFMGASDNYEDWYRIRLQAWDDLKRAVREANAQESNRGANLFAALDHIVFQDREMLHMLGDLRLCLNALNRHFRG